MTNKITLLYCAMFMVNIDKRHKDKLHLEEDNKMKNMYKLRRDMEKYWGEIAVLRALVLISRIHCVEYMYILS